MRRLVFLDFDGVVMTAQSYESAPLADRNSPTYTRDVAANRMDPRLVERVSRLCLRTEANIVLSTSWRGSGEEDRLAMEEALWMRGLDTRIPVVGQTPNSWGHKQRGEEIEQWLDQYRPGWTHDRIVILDDDGDMEPLTERWVRADGFRDGGFSVANLDAALMLFGFVP